MILTWMERKARNRKDSTIHLGEQMLRPHFEGRGSTRDTPFLLFMTCLASSAPKMALWIRIATLCLAACFFLLDKE